jgi:hypothetical protein
MGALFRKSYPEFNAIIPLSCFLPHHTNTKEPSGLTLLPTKQTFPDRFIIYCIKMSSKSNGGQKKRSDGKIADKVRVM